LVLSRVPDLQVWDVGRGGAPPACVRRIPLRETSYGSLCIDRRGGVAWLARTSAQTWVTGVDLATGRVLEIRKAPVTAQVAACDGRGGIAVGSRDGAVAYSAGGASWVTARPCDRVLRSIAFDEAGASIVAAAEGGRVYVLRTSDLATLLVLDGHSGDAYQAEFLPGGRRIVSVSRDHTVRLWDAADGENVLVLHEHGYPVTCVAVSPDGSRIATAAGTTGEVQATVKIWAAPPAQR
jgi:WD40 repeat protein